MVQHRVSRRTNRRLNLHFDEFLEVELLEQILGQRAWKIDALRNCLSGRLGQHGYVLQSEIAEKAFGNTCISYFLGKWRSHAFDFSACQDCGVRHVRSFFYRFYFPGLARLFLAEIDASAVFAFVDSSIFPTRWYKSAKRLSATELAGSI